MVLKDGYHRLVLNVCHKDAAFDTLCKTEEHPWIAREFHMHFVIRGNGASIKQEKALILANSAARCRRWSKSTRCSLTVETLVN